MTPTALPRRSRASKAMLCLVLAVHLGALLLSGHVLRPHERAPGNAAARPLWLRLLPERTAPAEVESTRRPADRPLHRAVVPRATPPTALTERVRPAAPATAAEAISTPISTPINTPAAEAPVAAHLPKPPASRPLDLRAPPATMRTAPPPAALARDDQRANTPRLSSEQRMARAIGTDQTLHETVMPDGTRTFRRGRDCVIARPARESQLNPFNQSVNPTPRGIDSC